MKVVPLSDGPARWATGHWPGGQWPFDCSSLEKRGQKQWPSQILSSTNFVKMITLGLVISATAWPPILASWPNHSRAQWASPTGPSNLDHSGPVLRTGREK